jgi:hypothetical protein
MCLLCLFVAHFPMMSLAIVCNCMFDVPS